MRMNSWVFWSVSLSSLITDHADRPSCLRRTSSQRSLSGMKHSVSFNENLNSVHEWMFSDIDLLIILHRSALRCYVHERSTFMWWCSTFMKHIMWWRYHSWRKTRVNYKYGMDDSAFFYFHQPSGVHTWQSSGIYDSWLGRITFQPVLHYFYFVHFKLDLCWS